MRPRRIRFKHLNHAPLSVPGRKRRKHKSQTGIPRLIISAHRAHRTDRQEPVNFLRFPEAFPYPLPFSRNIIIPVKRPHNPPTPDIFPQTLHKKYQAVHRFSAHTPAVRRAAATHSRAFSPPPKRHIPSTPHSSPKTGSSSRYQDSSADLAGES